MRNTEAFFALLQAGLWEKEVRLAPYGEVDYSEILKLATEQSVVGLIAAGLGHVTDMKVPQEWALQFVGQTLQIEQRNKAMNVFVARLIEKLRENDIYALLVKGQGIAQCYEKPLWRSCGDVDLLLSDTNYDKAKKVLMPLVSNVEQEFVFLKHLGMTIDGWEVELHGSQRPRLTEKIDGVVDEVRGDVFYGGNVRSWMNGHTQVFLPGVDCDVIFVLTHILHHYYQEGVGLRRICDWCRLLYSYKDSLNYGLLENRLKKMGLVTEWKAFYNLTSRYLGMPDLVQGSGLMVKDSRLDKKADRIMQFVMECGIFGHKRSPNKGKTRIGKKAASLWRRTADSFRHFATFPKNSLKIWWYMVCTGFKVVGGE